jgi:holo-[acyl-carrier protein] synthase
MIYGIGVDLIRVERIEQAMSRWGGRFEARIFTPAEVEASRRRHRPGSHLAMRLRGQGGLFQGRGAGAAQRELLWRDIEVAHDPRGKPFLRLHGTAAAVAARIGLTPTSVPDRRAGPGQAFVIVEV